MVLGCCGAGKSTLSTALSSILGFEVIHLDQYYWKENWVETPKEDWSKVVASLVQKDQWIMDGNYSGTLQMRLGEADTVVYLDFPTRICMYRVIKRIITYWHTVRPDMSPGCAERFDLEFLHYVCVFNLVRRKPILSQLSRVEHEKDIYVLKNDKEVRHFLEKIEVK